MPSEIKCKYGLQWTCTDMQIELSMIESGGFKVIDGQKFGLGLFEHFMRARELAWPERYRHRWTDLIYNEIINNIVTVLMGAGSTQKTSHASEWVLLDYWANPGKTLVLVSTTTIPKLDLAVFGEIKMLHAMAKARWPHLPGNMLESKRAMATDDIKVNNTRDIRKGIIGRACYVGHQYVGLGDFAGIKQERIRFLADELQFMATTFFDCLPNMFQSAGLGANGDPEIKVIGSGNPKHDPYDQLSIAAEPVAGWESVASVSKTTCWDTKFHRGRCVNLIGTDSPNFDVAEGAVPPYPRLISRNSVNLVLKRWKKDSLQYYSQCVGKMVMGMIGNRVITKELCEQHHAMEKAVWVHDRQTKIGFLDPAWGGPDADRCVWGWLEYGHELSGRQIMRLCDLQVVPILATLKSSPDDQIAQWVKKESMYLGIDPGNLFYDSTGRGTVGAAFARVFGSQVPNPIAFGDPPTDRPVRYDLFIVDRDTGQKRLKRCNEEYGKLVTELWFSVRNVIECDQFREMREDVMREGCMREYTLIPSGKIDVEKKAETKERMGESPDLFDALAVGVEGARQTGFKIGRLGYEIIEKEEDVEDWIAIEAKKYEKLVSSQLLQHA